MRMPRRMGRRPWTASPTVFHFTAAMDKFFDESQDPAPATTAGTSGSAGHDASTGVTAETYANPSEQSLHTDTGGGAAPAGPAPAT